MDAPRLEDDSKPSKMRPELAVLRRRSVNQGSGEASTIELQLIAILAQDRLPFPRAGQHIIPAGIIRYPMCPEWTL